MKYLRAFFHSLYFSWVCFWGGSIEGGEWMLLWTIKVRKPVKFKDLNIWTLHDGPVFMIAGGSLSRKSED